MARFRLMEPQEKAIYVAVGNDREEGLKTLRWTLEKWRSYSISIIILHVDITKFTVKTYFGTMPASSINDEMLEVLRKKEQEEIDNLLSRYKAFCGKVKAEILRVEKYDKPTREHIIDLISGLNITNLVVGLSFMKSSSRRSRSAIGGCFYIHQHRPEFCELFIISGGKQILISEDRSFINFDHGPLSPSSPNPDSPGFKHQWESYAEEIENYLQYLLSMNLDVEEDSGQESTDHNQLHGNSPMEVEMKELQNSNMSVAEKSEYLRRKLKELNEKIQLNINEGRSNSEKLAKAEWTISFCNRRTIEMETLATKEVENRVKLNKELDTSRELFRETLNNVEETKKEVKLTTDLQSHLLEKLNKLTELKSQAEEDLGLVGLENSSIVVEMEKLKRQSDVILGRIEYCKQRNTVGIGSFEVREFCGEEMRLATDNFSERMRIKSAGDLSFVYKARLNLLTVGIKLINHAKMSDQDFLLKVKLLSNIRHPNLVAMVGFCFDPKCIVFEYMHNGNLRDILLSSSRNSPQASPILPWHARVKIAAQLCSALCFLHMSRPKPIAHGRLTASNVLLDRNLVAKINGLGLGVDHNESQIGLDVKAFGLLVMQLLTGSNWAGLVDEALLMDKAALARVLDATAGEWPLDLAEGLAKLAVKCLNTNVGPNTNTRLEMVMEEVEDLRKKVDGLVDRRECDVISGGSEQRHECNEVPTVFLCPIFQEVMENPHVAADGFSYELQAIQEWIKMGRDTSPMTNLKLNHKFLTPNHALHSLIHAWNDKRSFVSP